MTIKSILAACALLVTSLSSHADVVYEWEAINQERPWAFKMQLVFDDAIVNSGSYSLDVQRGYYASGLPNSGLIRMSYGFNGSHEEWSHDLRTEGIHQGHGELTMNMQFFPWNALANISINDGYTRFVMSGNTIMLARGDGGLWGSGCGMDDDYANCHGAQGRLRRIPEPTPVALLVLGALTGLAARRRQRARSQG